LLSEIPAVPAAAPVNLSMRSQGLRFRRDGWPVGCYIDVRRVSTGQIRTVQGTNQDGHEVTLITSEKETDWQKIPKVKK
jgi:hypothetical protein